VAADPFVEGVFVGRGVGGVLEVEAVVEIVVFGAWDELFEGLGAIVSEGEVFGEGDVLAEGRRQKE
jgi:hypothetical protein